MHWLQIWPPDDEVVEVGSLPKVGKQGRLWRSGRGYVRIQNSELMNECMR